MSETRTTSAARSAPTSAQREPRNESTLAALAPVRGGRAPRPQAWRRFRANRLAFLGLGIVGLLLVLAIGAPVIAPYPYDKPDFGAAWLFPSWHHLMGTDGIGRDFFSRIVYGARTSLAVGLSAQAIALVIGVGLGLLAGMRGGRVDFVVMRLVDAIWAFPRMLFAIMLLTVLGSGFGNVLIAIGVTGWIPICRLTRAQLLSQRENDYVLSARALGATERRIAFVHLLPNIVSPIIVALTLGVPEAIFAEAGLSFLGIGINPPIPSWGQMVGESMSYIRYYWHLALFPAVMIGLTMLGFVLLGDGLRDALDPRSKS
ncbi:MAG: oligopeptide transport system permease protein [Thermomicrobiales bacterium]|nr:oligopeptide transport system permease protein [Thermomicrobiales bacterium]